MDRELLGKRILQNCRNELYLDFPYLDGAFASLGYQKEDRIATIGTDGETIYFNPDFLIQNYMQNPGSVRRVYLHILLHCLYLHLFRKPQSQDEEAKQAWNRECDCFVEKLIEEAMEKKKVRNLGEKLPDDHSFWYRKNGLVSSGKSTEEKWERILAYTSENKAGTQSKAGTTSENRQEELDEIYRSRHDYRKFLKQFCTLREEVELDTESFDYIFYHFGMEQYGNLPLLEPLEYKEVNRLEELVIAIDTSGSCSRETVQRFLGETYAILSQKENFFTKMTVYILQCDCFLQKTDIIHSEKEWQEYSKKVTIQGRGGTDFRPVFEYIQKEKERKALRNLKALIYFTDGDGIYPRTKPDYETAFVFLKRTEKMKLVPAWAQCLIV